MAATTAALERPPRTGQGPAGDGRRAGRRLREPERLHCHVPQCPWYDTDEVFWSVALEGEYRSVGCISLKWYNSPSAEVGHAEEVDRGSYCGDRICGRIRLGPFPFATVLAHQRN